MIKKHTQCLLYGSLALLLSACSSSGGKPDNTSSSTSNITNTQTTSPLITATQTSSFMVKPAATEYQAEIEKAIQFTNQLRAEKGLPALKYNASLAAYAQRRAEEVAGRFSHTRPDGSTSFSTDIRGGGGENIAGGKTTAQETVLVQWRNSEGHYQNIIDPDYHSIGIGMVYWPGSEYGYYWVQTFGFGENSTTPYAFDTSSSQSHLETVAVKRESVDPVLNWLKLGSTVLELHDVSNNGTWHSLNQDGYSGIVSGYNETRFGVIRNGTQNYQAFYQGNNTNYAEMPQNGSAIYSGKALMSDGKTLNTNLDASIKADFSNKTLTGNLSEKGSNLINIQANIRGTTFYSTPNAVVETKGSFFGKNAREVGGIFYDNESGKFGAFSAKQ